MQSVRRLSAIASVVLLVWMPSTESAGQQWRSLFNGHDLDGWVNVNCAPQTFSVSNGIIVSTGIPTGILRSDRQYENFELELEYRHVKTSGNAGLFVWADPITSPGVPFARAIEVQILDGRNGENYTSHGDVFAIHGATFKPDRPHPGGWMRCLPSERRAHPAGQWNHYHVVCSNGVVRLSVNGKPVSGGTESRPRKGYVCLESEGSECHFRNIRVRELPSTHPETNEIALVAEEFQSLYTGVDLSGWKVEPWHRGHWEAKNWTLTYDGKAERNEKFFWSQRDLGDFVLIVDWRLPAKPRAKQLPARAADGKEILNEDGSRRMVPIEDAGDSGIYIRGSKRAEINIWCQPQGSGELTNYRHDEKLPADVRAAAAPKRKADRPAGQWNRFLITVRGQKVTVELNGERVIDGAELPDLPARGPIALQYHGDPIEFANLFVKSLN
jgi:3-keto-disaccharide hydrolase